MYHEIIPDCVNEGSGFGSGSCPMNRTGRQDTYVAESIRCSLSSAIPRLDLFTIISFELMAETCPRQIAWVEHSIVESWARMV